MQEEISKVNPFILLQNYLSEEELEDLKLVNFSTEESIKEYFQKIWRKDNLVQYIASKIPNNFPGKNDEKFLNLLNEGYNFQRENKFTEALLKYNNSILFASHLKDESGQSKVAKLYAVRSILLYEMGRFENALYDIKNAFKHGYFKVKQERQLLYTKIACLIKLNRNYEAYNLIKQHYEQAKEEQDDNWLRELKYLKEMCYSELNEEFIEDSFLPTYTDYKSEMKYRIRSFEKYEETNIINNSIWIRHSQDNKDRHFFANKNIEPGELLMTERAICSIPRLDMETLRLFCCVCNIRIKIALPCVKCSLVTFCSNECIVSRNNNHKMECSILFIFKDMNNDDHLPLVFRTLLKFKMTNILSKCVHQFENQFVSPENFVNSPIIYKTLTYLNGNYSKRNGFFCLQMAANAVLCVKLLQRVSEFWKNPDKLMNSIEQNFESLTYLGGEIIKMQLSFMCNAYNIKELQIGRNKSIINAGSFLTGYGIYKSFSLLNHSCSPNSLYSNYKNMLYLYSINFIPEGHPILVDYGVRYVNSELSYRKDFLNHYYCFDCKCLACVKNWSVFHLLPDDYDLIFSFCSSIVKKDLKLCSSYSLPTIINHSGIELQEQNELRKIVSNIKEACKKCLNSLFELQQNQFTIESKNNIANFISLLQKYTKLPHTDIVWAETILHVWFGLIGNKHYIDSN